MNCISWRHLIGGKRLLGLALLYFGLFIQPVILGQEIYDPTYLDERKLEELIPLVARTGVMAYPINTIRIANRFISSGQKQSVDAIKRFLQDAPESDSPMGHLEILIPILFPLRCQTKLPPGEFVNQTDLMWKAPFDECLVIGDIPIDFYGQYGGSRREVEDISDLLEWMLDEAVFRKEQLLPISDPAQLVSDIESSNLFFKVSKNRSDGEKLLRKLIRWQIYSLVTDNLDKRGPWIQVFESNQLLLENTWQEVADDSRNRVWNGLLEVYK